RGMKRAVASGAGLLLMAAAVVSWRACGRSTGSHETAGLEVRIAKRLNRALGRGGKVFAHRYFARYLTTPTQTRNAIRYVLLNRKHHATEKKFGKHWFDPFSSAPWFA